MYREVIERIYAIFHKKRKDYEILIRRLIKTSIIEEETEIS